MCSWGVGHAPVLGDSGTRKGASAGRERRAVGIFEIGYCGKRREGEKCECRRGELWSERGQRSKETKKSLLRGEEGWASWAQV